MIKRLDMAKSFIELGKLDRDKQKKLRTAIKNGLDIKTNNGLMKRLRGQASSSEAELKFLKKTFKKYGIEVENQETI